jgi:hypothetical protein
MLRDSWRVSEKLDCPSNYRPHSRPRGQLNITGVVDGNITKSAPVHSAGYSNTARNPRSESTDTYQHNVNDLREALMGKRCCRHQCRNDGQRQSAPSQHDIEEHDQ